MASYPPPNQNVAIFNPLNFVSGGEGLTLDEGKKFFLQYPDAQGTENMETTNIDGVFTANDQAFFNDTITLEQTATGEDALNILVDSPGYAIRATTRTDPTTNTQITILPTATSGEINSIVQLGDALIYSTTGDLTGGSMAITALGAVDSFGVRLNETEEVVEIGGQLELLNKGIKFQDGTIQSTAYTGDGSEDLAEVLAVGNSAGTFNIDMNNNNIENVNILEIGDVSLSELDNTLTISQMGQKTFVNNLVSFEPGSKKLLFSPSAPGNGSICLGLSAGGSTAGDFAICIGQGSGNTSGNNCIAIGQMADCNPFGNSIVLSATGFGISPANTGLYIDSIRNISNSNALFYNTTTNEITYSSTGSGVLPVGNNSALAVSVYLPNDPANIARQNLVNVDFDNIALTSAGSQTIIQCRYTLNVVGTNGIIVAYSSGNFSFCPFRMANSNPFGFSKQPLNDPGVSIPTYTGITAWNTAVGATNPIYDELAYLSFEWDSASPLFFTLYTIKDPAVLSQNTQYTFNLEILNCGGSVYNLPAPAPADWNTTITPNVSTTIPYTPP